MPVTIADSRNLFLNQSGVHKASDSIREPGVVQAVKNNQPLKDFGNDMRSRATLQKDFLFAASGNCVSLTAQASATEIKGQVLGGGTPIAQSSVALMQARAGHDRQGWKVHGLRCGWP